MVDYWYVTLLDFIPLCTAPIPPPPPPKPIISPIPPELPPGESEIEVPIKWEPPEAPGGELREYIVFVSAVGDASQSESRRRRQAAGSFLDICVVNINRTFSVPPNVTQLDVSAGMFSKIFLHSFWSCLAVYCT